MYFVSAYAHSETSTTISEAITGCGNRRDTHSFCPRGVAPVLVINHASSKSEEAEDL